MKLAFTICSNNYLSQAKVLGDSMIQHNPDYKFVIGLCDKKDDRIDYSFLDSFDILEVEALKIANFEWMIYNYNIIELNTAIKPFYFQHFMRHYPDAEIIIYFDPDIKLYNSLHILEDEIKGKTIVLTPHILTPIMQDGKTPGMNIFLNYGLYNLGFLALHPCSESKKILDWWQDWLSAYSLDCVREGFFVDQLPMNYAPLFFEHVCVSKNLGYNFAYWNFHERILSLKDDKYFLNETSPLIFTHFSTFKPVLPLNISRYQTRYEIEDGSVLYDFFREYYQLLIDNKYWELINIPCFYDTLRTKELSERQRKENSKLKNKIHRIFRSTYFCIMRLKKTAN